MATHLINVTRQMYDGDDYVLIDGAKTSEHSAACCKSTHVLVGEAMLVQLSVFWARAGCWVMLGKPPLLAHLTVASRPDHVIMSSKVYGAAQSARIVPVRHIST